MNNRLMCVLVPILFGFFTGYAYSANSFPEANSAEFTISGRCVYGLHQNIGLDGVSVYFSRLERVVTDEDGYYSQSVPAGWSGCVYTDLDGEPLEMHADPLRRCFENLSSNQYNQDFYLYNYKGGQVRAVTPDNIGIESATVEINQDEPGESSSWRSLGETDADGVLDYRYPDYGTTAYFRVSKENYSFSPPYSSGYYPVFTGVYESAKPDLICYDIQAASDRVESFGGNFWIEATIQNQGESSASGFWVNLYWIGGDDTAQDDDEITPRYYVENLPTNQQTTIRWDFPFPLPNPVGWSVDFKVTADCEGQIEEEDESNNQQRTTVLLFPYSISGRVTLENGTGLDGVALTLSDNHGSAVTSGGGYYRIPVQDWWSGSLTPSFGDFSFSPSTILFGHFGWDEGSQIQNFTAIPPTNPTIFGYVRLVNGSGVDGVTMTFSNGGGTIMTDGGGYYEQTLPYNWSGTLIPGLEGYSFDPRNKPFSDVISDRQQDFGATPPANPTISGRIVLAGGSGLAGVTLTLDNGGGSTTTREGGYWSQSVPYKWAGRITPDLDGYDFTPPHIDRDAVTTNLADQDFSAKPQWLKISGRIYSSYEKKYLENLIINFSDGVIAITESALNPGYYERYVQSGWSGTVSPNHPGYIFDKPHYQISSISSDLIIDFIAAPIDHAVLVSQDTLCNTTSIYEVTDHTIKQGANRGKRYLLFPDHVDKNSDLLVNVMQVQNLTDNTLNLRCYVDKIIVDDSDNEIKRETKSSSISINGSTVHCIALVEPHSETYLGTAVEHLETNHKERHFWERFKIVTSIVDVTNNVVLYKKDHGVRDGIIIYTDWWVQYQRREDIIKNLEDNWYHSFGPDDFKIYTEKVVQGFQDYANEVMESADWIMQFYYADYCYGLNLLTNLPDLFKLMTGQYSTKEAIQDLLMTLLEEISSIPLEKIVGIPYSMQGDLLASISEAQALYKTLAPIYKPATGFLSDLKRLFGLECPVDFHLKNTQTGGELYWTEGGGFFNSLGVNEAEYTRFPDGSKKLTVYTNDITKYTLLIVPELQAGPGDTYSLSINDYTETGERIISRFEDIPIITTATDQVVVGYETEKLVISRDQNADGTLDQEFIPQLLRTSIPAPYRIKADRRNGHLKLEWERVKEADEYMLNIRYSSKYDSTNFAAFTGGYAQFTTPSSVWAQDIETQVPYAFVTLCAKNDTSLSAPRAVCFPPSQVKGMVTTPYSNLEHKYLLTMGYLTYLTENNGSFELDAFPNFTQPIYPEPQLEMAVPSEVLNAHDAYYILSNLQGLRDLTDFEKALADVTDDELVDERDVMALLNHSVGLDPLLNNTGRWLFDPPNYTLNPARLPATIEFAARICGDLQAEQLQNSRGHELFLLELVSGDSNSEDYLQVTANGSPEHPIYSIECDLLLDLLSAHISTIQWQLDDGMDWRHAERIDDTGNFRIALCGGEPVKSRMILYTISLSQRLKPEDVVSSSRLLINGAFSGVTSTDVEYNGMDVPSQFSVLPFPNPFNSQLHIHVNIPAGARQHLKVTITNLLGERINTLYDATPSTNALSLLWEGRGDRNEVVASGVYYIVVRYGPAVKLAKVLMLQ